MKNSKAQEQYKVSTESNQLVIILNSEIELGDDVREEFTDFLTNIPMTIDIKPSASWEPKIAAIPYC